MEDTKMKKKTLEGLLLGCQISVTTMQQVQKHRF